MQSYYIWRYKLYAATWESSDFKNFALVLDKKYYMAGYHYSES